MDMYSHLGYLSTYIDKSIKEAQLENENPINKEKEHADQLNSITQWIAPLESISICPWSIFLLSLLFASYICQPQYTNTFLYVIYNFFSLRKFRVPI